MHRGRSARLDRLTRLAGEGDNAAAERYGVLHTRAAIGEAVRWSLARQGIDPSRVAALRVADEAEAELAVLGEPPPPAEPSAWGGDPSANPLSRLDDRMNRLVAHYRGGGEAPDLAQASLAELLAWCIAADGAGST